MDVDDLLWGIVLRIFWGAMRVLWFLCLALDLLVGLVCLARGGVVGLLFALV